MAQGKRCRVTATSRNKPFGLLVLDTFYTIFVGPWNVNCIFPVAKTIHI